MDLGLGLGARVRAWAWAWARARGRSRARPSARDDMSHVPSKVSVSLKMDKARKAAKQKGA